MLTMVARGGARLAGCVYSASDQGKRARLKKNKMGITWRVWRIGEQEWSQSHTHTHTPWGWLAESLRGMFPRVYCGDGRDSKMDLDPEMLSCKEENGAGLRRPVGRGGQKVQCSPKTIK